MATPMARRSLRNFITQFRAMELDDTELGPKVSEDIQLTYQMDDFSRYTRGQYAAGGFFSATANNPFMQLEVRSPFGVIVEYMGFTFLSPTPQAIGFWLQDTANDIEGPVQRLAITAGPAPDSIALFGHILGANIPTNRFAILSDRGAFPGINGLFIPGRPPNGPSQFLACFLSGTTSNNFGIRWTELNKHRTGI